MYFREGKVKYIFCSLIAFILISCAMPNAYYQNINRLIGLGQFSQADNLTETSKEKIYGQKNALLYYLDRGLVLHLGGNYSESNLMFEKAKKLSEDYFTKSITTEASTLLVSDNMRPYYGEDFERVLINIFCALNYILLGQESEALVEARQADHLLTTLQVNYGYKNKYKEDPFARYLLGMIYENQGEINDAFISYWKALESYDKYANDYKMPVPRALVNDALRTATVLGFNDDIESIKAKWQVFVSSDSFNKNTGEIVVINYNGVSPVKIDSFFEISFGKAWIYVNNVQPKGDEQANIEQAKTIARSILSDEQVRMAFPKYVSSSYSITDLTVSVRNVSESLEFPKRAELVDNIGAIAEKNLEDRINRVRIRTIVRAAIKFALSHQISDTVKKNSKDEALGWLVKKALTAVSTATELADKRSWRLLPDKISMTRFNVKPGKYSLQLSFTGQNDGIIEDKTIENISVTKGKKTFVIVRTIQ